MSRYELLERIGVGGMAEIFRGRATAVGGFEKPVAIKKILPHLGRDDRFVRMLIAEAKILAGFRQRNIVQVYDVGLGEDGEYFLVLEFVDGCDLGNLYDRMEAKRARFPFDLALHIGSEVCDALDHAHRATDPKGKPIGLVHRDVSPSNVLLSYSGEVKLTDFGIAKKAETQASVVSESLAGKFAYMSPEQARAAPLDGKSDIYSCGVVLYELLLGRRLFSGANEFEALRLVREGRVPRPREVDPTFNRELESLLMKALEPEPKNRYESAAAFAAVLRDYRYSASTSAGDPSKEISGLVRRWFPPGSRAAEASNKIVRIQTAAGFDLDGRQLFDKFDASASGEFDAAPPSTKGGRPGAVRRPVPAGGEVTGAHPLDSQGFDAVPPMGDDAETKLIDTRTRVPAIAPAAARPSGPGPATRRGPGPATRRGKEPTPTVRDMPIGSLFDELESSSVVLGTGAPLISVQPVEVLAAPASRRAVVWAGTLVVVAALLAFVIAGFLMSDDDGDKGRPAVSPGSPVGGALDGPSFTPPVKKKPR